MPQYACVQLATEARAPASRCFLPFLFLWPDTVRLYPVSASGRCSIPGPASEGKLLIFQDRWGANFLRYIKLGSNLDDIKESGFQTLIFRAVFANGPRDRGSILGRVIPKTLKMVLDTSLLNTQQYKVRIKGKVEQSWGRSSALR